MDNPLFRRVQLTAGVLGLIAVLLSLVTLDLRFISGVFLGAAIGWLNLLVVGTLYDRVVRAGALRGTVLGAYLLKFGVLAGVVTVGILVLGVDAIGFLVGFLTMVVAITVVPLLYGIKGFSGPEGGPPPGTNGQKRKEP